MKVKSVQKVKVRGQSWRSQRSDDFFLNLSIFRWSLQFNSTDCYEEVSYCFSWSSVQFQVQTGQQGHKAGLSCRIPQICPVYVFSKLFSTLRVSQFWLPLTFRPFPYWNTSMRNVHIDGLVQERHNSVANAQELRFSCTNSSMLFQIGTSIFRMLCCCIL